MKKITFLILVLFLPFFMVAQLQPAIIKVNAHAVHTDTSPEFKATVVLSSSYSSLPAEMTTLKHLKNQYKQALENKGISWGDVKEKSSNDFGYESMGYDKAGVLYQYKTKSVQEMKNFLEIRTLGLQYLNYVSIITIDEKEAAVLSEKALENAKSKALIIANAMGKQLGAVQEVEDLNNRWGEKVVSSIYYDRPATEYVYNINVIFALK